MGPCNQSCSPKTVRYFLVLIFASTLIQAAPSPDEVVSSVQIVPRQEDTGEAVDPVTAIANSETAPEALQNWGNLIAHIFTQVAQIPVAILTGVGVIKPPPTPAPAKVVTQGPTVIQVVLAPTPAPVSYHQVAAAQPQQQQAYQPQPQQQQAYQPQPQRVYQPQPVVSAPAVPQPQPQVNENKPEGGENRPDGGENKPEGGDNKSEGGEDSGDGEDNDIDT